MTVQQTVTVQPYLFFDGKCEEALEFYKGAIGAKVEMMMRFKENPDQPDPSHMPPNSGDKVMHAAFRVGETQVLASDGHCAGKPSFQGFGLDAERQGRRRGREAVRRRRQGRSGPAAADQDLLRLEVRHGHRQVRHHVDGDRGSEVSLIGAWPPARSS